VRRKLARLGVYSDGPFHIAEGANGKARLAPDPADYPFLTFAATVGRQFSSTVVFARASTAAPPDGSPTLPEHVEFVRLPYYSSLTHLGELVRALPGTARAFWRGLGRVDAVWVIGPHPLALVLVPLALVRGRRVVLGVRQDTLAYYRSRLPRAHWRYAMIAAHAWDGGFRLLARRLRITVVGKDLASHYGGERPRLLTTTVTLMRAEDVVDAPRPRDWSGPISLFTVGRIDREKNPLLLVEALGRLEREQPGRFSLAWAGTGPLEDDVRRRAHELGVADRIELLGFVPFGPELLDRYRNAHAFVHVSLTEGVPATVIEALASGTPVVATAVGGVPAALEGGAAGLLVPPSNVEALVAAILQLIDEPEERDDRVRHGLGLASRNTLEAQAARIARFIAGDGGAPYLAEGTVPRTGV
jgi:glycosyltransferase involved in cell wall biosynthesis